MTDAEFSSHRSKIPYMALRARVTEADHEASVRGHVNVIAWEAVDEGPTAENGSTEIIGITIETIIENGVVVVNVIIEEEEVERSEDAKKNIMMIATNIANRNQDAKDRQGTIWIEERLEGNVALIGKRIANGKDPGIDETAVLNFYVHRTYSFSLVYTTTVLACIST